MNAWVGLALAAAGMIFGLAAAWLSLDDARRCPPQKRALRLLAAGVCGYSGLTYAALLAGAIPPELSSVFLRPAHVSALALFAALVIVER